MYDRQWLGRFLASERTCPIVPCPPLSEHAHLRLAQRNFSAEDLAVVLRLGVELHRAGAEWYVLRRCDLRRSELQNDTFERLVGVVVCLEHGVIRTVYRNDRPIRHVMRKAKHYRRKGSRWLGADVSALTT